MSDGKRNRRISKSRNLIEPAIQSNKSNAMSNSQSTENKDTEISGSKIEKGVRKRKGLSAIEVPSEYDLPSGIDYDPTKHNDGTPKNFEPTKEKYGNSWIPFIREREKPILPPPPKKLKEVVFHSTLNEIITAISENKPVEGIDLIHELQNPSFRFRIENDPAGYKLSEAFTKILTQSRSSAGKKGAKKSSAKRNESADEFAKEMYDVIEHMKAEAKVKTIRDTVHLLNLEGVKTPNGGKWRINTIQTLQKRWRELGLIQSPKPK